MLERRSGPPRARPRASCGGSGSGGRSPARPSATSSQLGASLDYHRERFTWPTSTRARCRGGRRAVPAGYLYRANRMINWCPQCATAISDLEVEHREVDGRPTPSTTRSRAGHVTVATVRPATPPGDTGSPSTWTTSATSASSASGRSRRSPRPVPIVDDEYVDLAVGTGALKTTPAHDPNYFEIGRRDGLAEIADIGFDGRITDAAGERYAGRPAGRGQMRVVADLRSPALREEQP